MGTVDYAAPLEGNEHIIERPDGTRLHTTAIGSGAHTVLLAHGYGSASDAWNLVAPELASAGLRAIAFDQRGHGDSTIGTDGVGTRQMTADYAAILDHYEVENATLVGHSMGGFLSIAFLLGDASAVDRVGSLVLMATFAGDVSRKNPQNRLQIPLIKWGILTRLLGFAPIAKAFTKSLSGDGFDPAMVDCFIPTFEKADHQQLIPILEAMVNESNYGRIGEIKIPTTVIVGSKDKTTPPFHTEDLHAGIAGSTLMKLPGVGHGLNWEAPDDIVEAIVGLAEA
ncbi:MAG: alpha/beta hydrolase [Acidimicrobiia bacterium]|nr:alpha/beta hydrolase [Acidimicrobiia bacterium]